MGKCAVMRLGNQAFAYCAQREAWSASIGPERAPQDRLGRLLLRRSAASQTRCTIAVASLPVNTGRLVTPSAKETRRVSSKIGASIDRMEYRRRGSSVVSKV